VSNLEEIKKVEMFQTCDGELFKSKFEAEAHLYNEQLWQSAILEYGRYDEVTFHYKSDFIEFLTNHRISILRILGVHSK
jgi:hypothetical protein